MPNDPELWMVLFLLIGIIYFAITGLIEEGPPPQLLRRKSGACACGSGRRCAIHAP